MPQTVEQSPWLTEGEEKRSAVRDMFAQIAPSYDRVNSMMSFRLHYRWRSIAVSLLDLKPGDKVLDLCCGTGDFFAPLRKILGAESKIVGLDYCRPMLAIASKKLGQRATLIEADACNIPISSESFQAVTIGWGLRNVPDIQTALHEAFRILKPGGKFVSLDMARPQGIFGAISEKACHTAVPLLGKLVGHTSAYQYLPQSTLKFDTRQELQAKMTQAGFTEVQFRNLFFGNICIHWGQKPEGTP